MMSQQIDNFQRQWKKFLNKKMDRKSFIAHLGAGVFAATGISAALKSIDGSSSDSQANRGYGDNAYGGSESNSNTKLNNRKV